MSGFDILVVGVGDAFTDRHVNASLVLTCDGFHLAIDCPDRYRSAIRRAAHLAESKISSEQIDDLLITHVHGDHMNGLEGFGFYKHFVQRRRLRLYLTEEVREVIWDRRLVASMGELWDGQRLHQRSFEDYFDHRHLSWTDTTRIGPFTVRTRRTLHHVPTAALLIHAGGKSVGYSADTAYDPGLIEFLSSADLIIHETNYGPAHTAYEQLCRLPPAVTAKLRLIHYPDSFDIAGSRIAPLLEGQLLHF